MAEAALLDLPPVPPKGYPPLVTEPVFDPARHLQLEKPERIIRLAELGYGADEIATCPSGKVRPSRPPVTTSIAGAEFEMRSSTVNVVRVSTRSVDPPPWPRPL